MKVEDLMTTEIGVCRPSETLSRAVEIMWRMDCGIVPVVDEYGRAVGVITDRDIAVAATWRNRRTSEIFIGEMSFSPLKVCAADDDVKDALRRMRKYRIKRLCVTDDAGRLVGMLSLSDVIAFGASKKSVRKLVFSTLRAISKPLPIVLEEKDEVEPDEISDEADDDLLEIPDTRSGAATSTSPDAAPADADDEDDDIDDDEDHEEEREEDETTEPEESDLK